MLIGASISVRDLCCHLKTAGQTSEMVSTGEERRHLADVGSITFGDLILRR